MAMQEFRRNMERDRLRNGDPSRTRTCNPRSRKPWSSEPFAAAKQMLRHRLGGIQEDFTASRAGRDRFRPRHHVHRGSPTMSLMGEQRTMTLGYLRCAFDPTRTSDPLDLH